MIVAMNKLRVYGLHSDRKAVLEALQKEEIVEIREPDAEDVSFMETTKSIAQFDKYMRSAEAALAVLDAHCREKKGLLAGRRSQPIERYSMASTESDETLRTIYQIIALSEKIKAHTDGIGQIVAKQKALEPYLALDVPMDIQETAFTTVKTGTLRGLWTPERLQKELEQHALHTAHAEILSASRERSFVWMVFPSGQAQEADALLRKAGFAEPSYSGAQHAPAKKKAVLEEAKAALQNEIEGYAAQIRACDKHRRDIELFYDHLCLRKEKYRVLSKTGLTEYAFVIEGFVPEKHAARIKELLESNYAACVEIDEADEADDVPVAFSNNAFAAPVEGITEMYSMPSATDIDPNPVMAFFYYLFFGLMFSDAGYGLLLVLACGYLGFGKRLEEPKRRNYKMFFFCGISTVFWGLMFGGFFGNILYTVSTTFWGREITLAPIWLDPISRAMDLLIFSVSLGILQIVIGMGIQCMRLCRQRKVADAVCDVGFWILVLLGICVMAAGMGLGAAALAEIGKWGVYLGAAGLLLTGGRKSKNLAGKIFGGLAGLYNITGYVSDALSYCRLMALGLATGAIANVVNMLGAMFGGNIVGALLFLVVAVLGHSLNFAMNMLGAYVHTNRLQYVEFFSKFYEGGGRKFDPFRMNTRFYRFTKQA